MSAPSTSRHSVFQTPINRTHRGLSTAPLLSSPSASHTIPIPKFATPSKICTPHGCKHPFIASTPAKRVVLETPKTIPSVSYTGIPTPCGSKRCWSTRLTYREDGMVCVGTPERSATEETKSKYEGKGVGEVVGGVGKLTTNEQEHGVVEKKNGGDDEAF